LLHLLSFATSFGSSLWVSFIGGIIMFKWVYYLFFPSSWRWSMCACACVRACIHVWGDCLVIRMVVLVREIFESL
jgi:hypothetical protein